MFTEYDRVRIKDKDVIGDIVDIRQADDGSLIYLVESDREGPSNDPEAWNLRFPIYTCTGDQLEKI